MEYDEDIIYNIINGFKRKDINKYTRCKFLRHAMKELKLSNRKFAEEFNIPVSTLKDWLVFDKITEQEYERCTKSGLTDTDIFRTLRNTKKENITKEINSQINKTEIKSSLDTDLKMCITLLGKHVKCPRKTEESEDLLIELYHTIRSIRSNNMYPSSAK